MLTPAEIDDQALTRGTRIGQFASKKLVPNSALTEDERMLLRKSLLALRDKVRWEGDLQAMRGPRKR